MKKQIKEKGQKSVSSSPRSDCNRYRSVHRRRASNLGCVISNPEIFAINSFTYDDFEKIDLARKGLSYTIIETLSKALGQPIKTVLDLLGIAQTTYNTNKKKESNLSSSSSELVILIIDLINYGIEVFNNENEKFLLWLNTSNVMLRKNTPLCLLDTTIGVNEVKLCLDRIEYGNFA
ncbi:DUF2384 domain-containing protein [Empedobacter falsenii]|uniref:antitoxin Xre/MbcA/ParS toxin-binding domain-containing protein n=1 Tax=Empedobacter falsenii TaxID=343874 RepID=UPI002576CB26|nr:antitoxin Xre/MbcA/ParS toxin-binding domain-containing protein [Empedobacter falsenii]MDM1299771.1 DUF2384 domain-containing protein [Empedobacter falsenii]MDM1319564.1 DUF2384 domain-containing protein [Empedobacter falsenii]